MSNTTTSTHDCAAVWCDEHVHTVDAVLPTIVHGTRRGAWDIAMEDGDVNSLRIAYDGQRALTAAEAHTVQADLQRAIRLVEQLQAQATS